ncbi:lysozyme inhibitor LprI family protein [Saccharibacillus endophyticus]|uniref:Lysozyme inhibitor LprI-like N-terminal domain-containing protein n=1 Tax=Saccharibacillus endophyticus TaxID=2060666 RepID=A0ABQ1ZLR5_9BACL|nr:lysozyme inhibitor LprI family protein [Saccharibacillus endophyticus]GGH68222.1 hypothetical protein GCM10007362_02000 [Saccharibacillus endophyticus]
MNKKTVFYRAAVLLALIVVISACAVMSLSLKKQHEKIELLESRDTALQQSLDQAVAANKSLKVQIEESKHLGDYQGNDDFSTIINDNPIDRDYEQERKILQESPESTTLAWGAFESKYLTKWQNEMNAALDGLSKILNEADRSNLEQSQKSWQSYMDDQAQFVMGQFLDTRYFGTQGDVQFLAAQSKQTRERTIRLMEYLFSIDREAIDFAYKS